MKATLDRALADTSQSMTGLCAVVLSAAPDGLIAWSWSRDGRHDGALGFTALDRAATVCLESMKASERGRCLVLSCEDTWVLAWPLHENASTERERLVITTVFAGTLEAGMGMFMVWSSRIRKQIALTLNGLLDRDYQHYRTILAERMLARDDAVATLRGIATAAGVDLQRIGRPELLDHDERSRVLRFAQESSTTH